MSTISDHVVKGTPGLMGFDSDTIISADVAQQFFDGGYRFCIRYVPHNGSSGSGDLSTQEANDILASGLALMAVMHVRPSGWIPTQDLGTADGYTAADYARSIGYPVNLGLNLWCDLEGVDTNSNSAAVVAYCNAWFDAVSQVGYAPGLYVGYNALLSSEQLYYDLKFQHYWKSGSSVPDVAVRGYQLVQSNLDVTKYGIQIDEDQTQTDNLGGTVHWLIQESAEDSGKKDDGEGRRLFTRF